MNSIEYKFAMYTQQQIKEAIEAYNSFDKPNFSLEAHIYWKLKVTGIFNITWMLQVKEKDENLS